uniref:Fe2OG dioxygenase domain-containing protein n=1 Tax=Alexandrium monilatum TaxID=311494 RepID=A0A7S4WDZ4_9DINO
MYWARPQPLVGTVLAILGLLCAGLANPDCRDSHTNCEGWAEAGECIKNPEYMATGCCVSCRKVAAHCEDHEQECSNWAASGECRRNIDYMVPACPLSCRVCHVHFRPDCRRPPGTPEVVQSGTVDKTFQRVLTDFPQYRPQVLHRDPWVLQLEGFLQLWEADRLVQHAGRGLTRSLAADKLSEIRTSTQTFCNHPECLSDGLVQAVWSRIANVTRVPRENAEHMQLLRYEPGQAYREHHDQNAHRLAAWGPRLYTFFMYLSDVEEGGETVFPGLNITVQPRKGRALLWPSVHSDHPFTVDDRTRHEAVAVRKGLKYAANFWLHPYDFQGPYLRGCQQTVYFQDFLLDEIWPVEENKEL